MKGKVAVFVFETRYNNAFLFSLLLPNAIDPNAAKKCRYFFNINEWNML